MNRTPWRRLSIGRIARLDARRRTFRFDPGGGADALVDVPNTRLFNFVDTPAEIEYSQSGEATVPLNADGTGIISIRRFRQVSVLLGTTSATSFSLAMGKISNTTLAAEQAIPMDRADPIRSTWWGRSSYSG